VRKFFIAAGTLFGFLIIALSLFMWWLGAFSPVEVSEGLVGPYVMVYEDMVGDYKQTGKVLDRIYQSLQNDKIATTKGFGIYYDNPEKVPAAKLRSRVGCIIEEKDQPTVLLQSKYRVTTFPPTQSVKADFPYKNKMSIFIGIAKAYPALAAYAHKQGYQFFESLEVYDMPNKKISYSMRCEKK